MRSIPIAVSLEIDYKPKLCEGTKREEVLLDLIMGFTS